MKVSELIAILQQCPNQDLRVALNGYEGGFTELKKENINQVKLLCNVNEENWYGPHDWPDSVYNPEAYALDDFLVLSRTAI